MAGRWFYDLRGDEISSERVPSDRDVEPHVLPNQVLVTLKDLEHDEWKPMLGCFSCRDERDMIEIELRIRHRETRREAYQPFKLSDGLIEDEVFIRQCLTDWLERRLDRLHEKAMAKFA